MIMLAVDPELRSGHALPVVAALALAGRQRVLALHVSAGAWPVDDPAALVARRLRDLGVDAHFDTIVAARDGVAGAILRRAAADGATTIALGSRGRSSLGGLVLGSVSHQVLAGAECQVLTVHGVGPAETIYPADISKIMVAVDLSPESAAALAAVERLAPRLRAKVLVTHVSDCYQGRWDASYLEAEDVARYRVRHAVERLRQLGIRADWSIPATLWTVPQRIAAAADDWEADLLVVGSRRHGDLASILAGSVVHRLGQLTARPILVAERPERRMRSASTRLPELRPVLGLMGS